MAEYHKIVEHEGRRVLVVDFAGVKADIIASTITDVLMPLMVREKIPVSVIDTTNTKTSREVKAASSELQRQVIAACGFSYTSLIGLGPLQKIIANAISRDMYFASNVSKGIAWVVKKADAAEKKLASR